MHKSERFDVTYNVRMDEEDDRTCWSGQIDFFDQRKKHYSICLLLIDILSDTEKNELMIYGYYYLKRKWIIKKWEMYVVTIQ